MVKRITGNIVIALLVLCSIAAAQQPPEVQAKAAVLIDLQTGNVLYEKNAGHQMYPASTTKIMTALLAVELGDMAELVTVGIEVMMLHIDSSKAGLSVGDTITLEELVYGLMLPSGNDAAYVIAVHLARKASGDEDMSAARALAVFADMMNRRAKELGAVDTNFANPDGYYHQDHYTTARDMAIMTREAMTHPLLCQVAATSLYVPKTWTGPHARSWGNTNQLVRPASENYYELATGLKTGWTSASGFTLVATASADNVHLAAVVFNTTRQGRWADSVALLEHGFAQHSYHQVLGAKEIVASLRVANQAPGQPEQLPVQAAEGFGQVFDDAHIGQVEMEVVWGDQVKDGQVIEAPLVAGQEVGQVIISLHGSELFRTPLVVGRDVAAMPLWRRLLMPGTIGLALGLLGLLRVSRKRRRRYTYFPNLR